MKLCIPSPKMIIQATVAILFPCPVPGPPSDFTPSTVGLKFSGFNSGKGGRMLKLRKLGEGGGLQKKTSFLKIYLKTKNPFQTIRERITNNYLYVEIKLKNYDIFLGAKNYDIFLGANAPLGPAQEGLYVCMSVCMSVTLQHPSPFPPPLLPPTPYFLEFRMRNILTARG